MTNLEILLTLYSFGACPPLLAYIYHRGFRRWFNGKIDARGSRGDMQTEGVVLVGVLSLVITSVVLVAGAALAETITEGSPAGLAVASLAAIFPLMWMKKKRENAETARREALQELADTDLEGEQQEASAFQVAQSMSQYIYPHERLTGIGKFDTK